MAPARKVIQNHDFSRRRQWNLAATYTIYASCALLSALFVAKVVAETKGTRLEAAD